MMSPEKVRAIRNIVASQVPGLTVGAVTVTSTDGRLLAAATDESDPSGIGAGGTRPTNAAPHSKKATARRFST